MSYSRISRSKVTPNTKIEALDRQTLAYDGTTDAGASWTPAEGAPIAWSLTRPGFATAPTGAATAPVVMPAPVLINFVQGNRSDVIHVQSDVMDNPGLAGVSVQAGGLTGIRGPANLGFSSACWDSGVLPTIGHGIFVGASGLLDSEAMVANRYYYGVVERQWDGQAYVQFSSVAWKA